MKQQEITIMTKALKPIPYSNLSKLLYLFCFTMWMSIITLNNILDPGTNIKFIGHVLKLDLIDPEGQVGIGLLSRAINYEHAAIILLYGVIFIELVVDILMWIACFKMFRITYKKQIIDLDCLKSVNLALSAFLVIFICFLVSGIWFGYWMYMGQFQVAHLLGVIITMLGLIYFNQNAYLIEK